jgi:signal transduction histidine kinase
MPAIIGDAFRLEQVVLNLLTNAIKFTPEGDFVTIRAHCDPEGIYIEVVDSGIGIPGCDIENVLKPFIQVNSRLARKYQGTDLGLPITKKLVEPNGGTLSLTSILHVGTRITVTLPLSRNLKAGTNVANRALAS